MVTNINLSSPEVVEKRSLTGKSALTLSVVLLVIVAAAYAAVFFLKGKYENQEKEIDAAIIEKQSEIQGPAFSGALDFQERLNLLDKVVDDHSYWDGLFVKMGSYIIPEVRLDKFSGTKDGMGGGLIEISGIATSMDALSRELILLKSFPGVDSFEFKQAGEKISQASDQLSGISFEASLKMNKSSFLKY
jgi:Tfp pilus assembly protein PilN